MKVARGKEECAVVPTPAATYHARHLSPAKSNSQMFIYTYVCAVRQILVSRTLLLARRHSEEELLDAAIAPVAGCFLSNSIAVACELN